MEFGGFGSWVNQSRTPRFWFLIYGWEFLWLKSQKNSSVSAKYLGQMLVFVR